MKSLLWTSRWLGAFLIPACLCLAKERLPMEFWPSQTEAMAIRLQSRPVLNYVSSYRHHCIQGFRKDLPGNLSIFYFCDADGGHVAREAFIRCRGQPSPTAEETGSRIQVTLPPGFVVFSIPKDQNNPTASAWVDTGRFVLPGGPPRPWQYPGLPTDYQSQVTEVLQREHPEYKEIFPAFKTPRPALVGKQRQLCWIVPCVWGASDLNGSILLMARGTAFTFSRGGFYFYAPEDEILWLSPSDAPAAAKQMPTGSAPQSAPQSAP